MKEMASSITALENEQIAMLASGVELELSGTKINKDDLILTEQPVDGYWVRNVDDITVAVANTVDSKLRQEWLAREFVHHVQNLRRAANLNVTERIRITFLSNAEINEAVQQHREYLCNETLAVLVAEEDQIEHGENVVVGEINLTLSISTMNERG